MASKPLIEEKIEQGKDLIESLDQSGVKARAAFWFYLESIEDWKLILGFEKYESKDIYLKIANFLSEKPYSNIRIGEITVSPLNDDLIRLIGVAIATPPDGSLQKIRFAGNVINGVFIEDAYIYRMNLD